MIIKRFVPSLIVAAAAAVSGSAHAAYVVLDGWQLITPVTTNSDIGRLNLVSGSALVEQEVNGLGQVFVGADFREAGSIFSVTFTKESVAGTGDVGAPTLLGEQLTISFANVAGVVTGLTGTGGFEYVFNSGTFTISGGAGVYASGNIVGIGGTSNSTAVIGGFNGDSTLLGNILAAVPGFDIRNSGGMSLLPALASGNVLFEAVTNNLFANQVGGPGPAACSFDATASCLSFNVASAGDAFLVQQAVPEPGSLALVGLTLVGLAAVQRRTAKKLRG